ncbi:MAG TPA: hypothetical protein VNM69_06510 [Bacillus sp. (in: firmicutes)]|nr:hypothetical protein [Bacillus sp. (in: firmicutes)]
MPLFVCDRCGCVDNTALGHYWKKDSYVFADKGLIGLSLCSECAPSFDKDGKVTGYGKWHKDFPKKKWDGKECVINRNQQVLSPDLIELVLKAMDI